VRLARSGDAWTPYDAASRQRRCSSPSHISRAGSSLTLRIYAGCLGMLGAGDLACDIPPVECFHGRGEDEPFKPDDCACIIDRFLAARTLRLGGPRLAGNELVYASIPFSRLLISCKSGRAEH
jgi:hypothetical protein